MIWVKSLVVEVVCPTCNKVEIKGVEVKVVVSGCSPTLPPVMDLKLTFAVTMMFL